MPRTRAAIQFCNVNNGANRGCVLFDLFQLILSASISFLFLWAVQQSSLQAAALLNSNHQ